MRNFSRLKNAPVARIATIAAPYIATAKPGDVLRVDTCTNPQGWWSVLRNDRPIHHLPCKEDAEDLAYAIAGGVLWPVSPAKSLRLSRRR